MTAGYAIVRIDPGEGYALPLPAQKRLHVTAERSERVKARLSDIRSHLQQPWLLSILFVAFIPVFPEYICPLLAICAFIAAYYDAKLHHRELAVGTVGKLLLVYMAYMAFTVLFSKNPMNSIATVVMWLVAFLVYLSMTTVLNSRHRFDTALFCMTLIAGLVGFIACVQYILNAWLNIPVSFYFWQWIDEVVYRIFPMPLTLDIHEMRAASTFNNPNVMAEYLIMMLPFAAYYAFSGRRTGTRILCRVCLLFALGGVLFSFSRGSYLALLVILLVFCVANIRKWSIILFGGISALALIPTSVYARLFSVGSMDNSITDRFRIWGIALQEIAKQPIFGSGPGVQNFWDILYSKGVAAPHTHNLVLQLLVEGGIIALVLMLLIGWKTFRGGYAMIRKQGESRTIGVVLIAFVGAFIMYGMVDFPLLCPKLVSIFMLVLGFSDCAAHLYLGHRVQALSGVLPIGPMPRIQAEGALFSKSK